MERGFFFSGDVYYLLPLTNYPLPITNYPLPITHYLLPLTSYLLPLTYLSDTFKLHSKPDAQHTIYLDFDGHVTENTSWKDGARIDSPAYDTNADSSSFSDGELETIQKIWQRVAEDFAPFNVNITTEAPDIEDLQKTANNDERWGIRVVVTQDDDTQIAPESGGIAYINSFNWASDTPAFSFNKGWLLLN